MSDATRAVALSEAGKLNLKSADEVLNIAARYDAFLTSEAVSEAATAKPATKAAAPAASGKKSTTKPAAKSEEQVVQEALDAAADAAGGEDDGAGEEAEKGLPATSEGVQAGIAQLLKANLRKEALTLLKKFGAASASGVKAKDFAKFVAEVQKLLPQDESASDDLTA